MIAAAALLALAAPARPFPEPLSARAGVMVRIVRAAAVRGGVTDHPHQRRLARSPEGAALTLIEFE